jgi:hypothetical protein
MMNTQEQFLDPDVWFSSPFRQSRRLPIPDQEKVAVSAAISQGQPIPRDFTPFPPKRGDHMRNER